MNMKEKKRVMMDIMKQLEQELETKVIPKKEAYDMGHHKAEIDNMNELITEMLAAGYIYRPAPGMFALKVNNPKVKAVKVVVTVERDGKEVRRVRYDDWLDTLTIKEIVETISEAIDSIDEA